MLTVPAEKQHEEMGKSWMGRKEGKREKGQERMSRLAERRREKEAKRTEEMMEKGGREKEGSGQEWREYKDGEMSGMRRRSCVSHILESFRLTGGVQSVDCPANTSLHSV